MTYVCECVSPQEQRLHDRIAGKEDRFRKTHTRVFTLLERFEGQKPRIDVERALYFTESMKETEGQHLTLRWAKALMHIAKNMTVYVPARPSSSWSSCTYTVMFWAMCMRALAQRRVRC